jgi:hypothetical protein
MLLTSRTSKQEVSQRLIYDLRFFSPAFNSSSDLSPMRL